MQYFIDYELSPIYQYGLNKAIDILVSVKQKNQRPTPGQEVSLKLVKNSNNKINNLKSNIEPEGYINNVVNPNITEGCIWQSTFKPELVVEASCAIQDFYLTKVGKIICLTDNLEIAKDFKIKGLKGNKVLVTHNGDYVVSDNKTIYLVSPALSNYTQSFTLGEEIIDFCIGDRDYIYVLGKTRCFIIYKGLVEEFKIPTGSNFTNIHQYQGRIFFINKQSCIVTANGKIVDSFDLNLDNDIHSFQSYQNNLIITTSDLDKITIWNSKTKKRDDLYIGFLNFPISKIKLDDAKNIYFSVGNNIYKIVLSKSEPYIDIVFENPFVLESFCLETSGYGNIKVLVLGEDGYWEVWNKNTDLDLHTYVIPVEKKTKSIRICWEGYNTRIITKIKDFLVQGSANFGQIIENPVLTDKNGVAKFTYITKNFVYPEKFVAIVKK